MRRLFLAVLPLFALACLNTVSPGGGTPGTATPNPNAIRDSGVVVSNMDAGTSTTTDRDGGIPTTGPGVSRDSFLDELSPGEKASLCAWVEQQQGGAGVVDCGEGTMLTVDSAAECIADTAQPHCAAGLIIDCMESLNGDPCQILATTECSDFLACAFGN